MIAIALATTYWGGFAFWLLWFAAFAAVAWEWHRMASGEGAATRMRIWLSWFALALAAALTATGAWHWAALAIAAAAVLCAFIGGDGSQRAVSAGGLLYAGLPLVAVVALRGDSAEGRTALFWLYAVVWTTDIGAYFVGRAFGGPKLWPSISPGKTWSGAVGGTLLGAGAGLLFSGATDDSYVLGALGLGASLASQAGDLFESALKRRFGVKDSSALIPGHGGVMDRLDGFIAAALLAAIVAGVNSESGNLGAGLFMW